MEPIKLSSDHKERLLEMCKTLYPKHEIYFDPDMEEAGILNFVDSKNNHNWIQIHWFELCMKHIMVELLSDSAYYSFFCRENTILHMVDFLYEKFKKEK